MVFAIELSNASSDLLPYFVWKVSAAGAGQARRLIACYGELSKVSIPHQGRLPVPHLLLDLLAAFCQVRLGSVVGVDLLAILFGLFEQRCHLLTTGPGFALLGARIAD